MKARKTALLASIAVLLGIYIIQLVLAGRSSVKMLTLKTEPDTYTIAASDGTTVLKKTPDGWTVGDKDYAANETSAVSVANAVKEIKVLDTVSHADSEAELERYGLTGADSFTVTASAGGKTLRTITVGKASSTMSQTYIKVDGGKEIYLASGSYKNTCGKNTDDLRSRELYNVNAEEITKVAVASPDASWQMEKSAPQNGAPAVWAVTAGTTAGEEPAQEKLSTFASSLAHMGVQSWAEDGTELPDTPAGTITVTAGGRNITVTVYHTGSADDVQYLAVSSESPYKFYLAKYMADKASQKLSEL